FQGLRNEDPLRHVKHYLSIIDNIQADRAIGDISRLRFFHFSLKGKAAGWLDRIPPTQIMTWDQLDNISHDNRRKLDQLAQFRFNSLTEEEGWNRIEEYVKYQDDLWDDMSPPMNISSISESMQPTFRGRLKRACNQISYLETPTRENDDTPSPGNSKRNKKREDGPKWIVRNKFEDELANFMLEKKAHTKGIGNMLDQHRVITQDPPFQLHHDQRLTTSLRGKLKKKGLRAKNQALYQPSKSSNLPFLSRLKKQKNDDEDECRSLLTGSE
ncbi:putative reverse transcriptase domain-containing protein, partial [Tanacetum coccineum]